MPQERELTRERLSALWARRNLPTIRLDSRPLAILSDFHLGNGSRADDVSHNEGTLVAALEHYAQRGYSLILLGDIEELWQFSPASIVARYGGSVYERLRAFGRDRIHRVFGNHDIEWAQTADPLWNEDGMPAPEALMLTDEQGVPRVLLAHGHQGSAESDRYGRLSRVFVRAFRWLEPLARRLGLYRNPATATSQIAKAYERIMHEWAKDTRVLLVCGHSHRAIFASRSYADRIRERITDIKTTIQKEPTEDPPEDLAGELDELRRILRDEIHKGRDIEPTEDGFPLPSYFNSGCALYTDGITALEIDAGEMRLVKWNRDPSVVPRREIYQRGNLSDFLAQIERAGGTIA